MKLLYGHPAWAISVLSGMLLTACGTTPSTTPVPSSPAAASPSSPASAAAKPSSVAAAADWAAVVEAAKKEGVVQCGCPPRPDYAKAIKDGFESANPGIRLEAAPAALPEFWVRVDKEQAAKQYLWDIYAFGPTIEMFDQKNKGGMESLRDFMVGPDIGGDAAWDGGMDGPFIDNEKKYVLAYLRQLTSTISINRDLLPAEISSYQELVNPVYKGKIVWQDPRIGGAGLNFLTAIYEKLGRDAIKKILVDQQPLLVKGQNEVAEALLRGGKPISMPNMSADTAVQYERAGVKMNLVERPLSDVQAISHGGSVVLVLKNPPHPNATKVYVNWVLSKAGQAVLTNISKFDSMRKDVAGAGPELARAKPGESYTDLHLEPNLTVKAREAQKIAQELAP